MFKIKSEQILFNFYLKFITASVFPQVTRLKYKFIFVLSVQKKHLLQSLLKPPHCCVLCILCRVVLLFIHPTTYLRTAATKSYIKNNNKSNNNDKYILKTFRFISTSLKAQSYFCFGYCWINKSLLLLGRQSSEEELL